MTWLESSTTCHFALFTSALISHFLFPSHVVVKIPNKISASRALKIASPRPQPPPRSRKGAGWHASPNKATFGGNLAALPVVCGGLVENMLRLTLPQADDGGLDNRHRYFRRHLLTKTSVV